MKQSFIKNSSYRVSLLGDDLGPVTGEDRGARQVRFHQVLLYIDLAASFKIKNFDTFWFEKYT